FVDAPLGEDVLASEDLALERSRGRTIARRGFASTYASRVEVVHDVATEVNIHHTRYVVERRDAVGVVQDVEDTRIDTDVAVHAEQSIIIGEIRILAICIAKAYRRARRSCIQRKVTNDQV